MTDPKIVIAARSWRIPLLSPRQLRAIIPAMGRLGSAPLAAYDDLLLVCYTALTKTYPELTWEVFEAFEITTIELLEALPVIAQQTGLMTKQRSVAARSPYDSFFKQPRQETVDWDKIIARMVTFLPGTEWDYWEDNLTIPRLEAIQNQWLQVPPIAVSTAALAGIKPQPAGSGVGELVSMFPSGQIRLN